MTNGILLIDKPVGMRSSECVGRIKRVLGRGERVGHAGTLDSTASGLLVILIGTATRLSDYVMRLPKVYEAAVRLGVATDTCDASGNVTSAFPVTEKTVGERVFDEALLSFLGTISQVPPEISALKIDGRAAHKIARAGKKPNLAARPVTITSISRISHIVYEPETSQASVKISVKCGKGTYIRAIARDIGAILACGAHTEQLRRLSVGTFDVSSSRAPAQIEDKAACLENIVSPKEAGRLFQKIFLTRDAETRLSNGLTVPMSEAGRLYPGSLDLSSGLYVEGERLFGFAKVLRDENNGCLILKPETNLFE
ncbi:tRNA pseudouridine synthase B [Synergistales bacterium]|nr:tRNA pseudouridine synthase B [Synergistales bacterium]